MRKSQRAPLTRREHQIMDILYRLERATAAEVMGELSGDPHYSTVRTQLRLLEEKGYVRHEEENLRYVYLPVVPQAEAGHSALKRLMDTFFEGSTENLVAALLGVRGSRLSRKELDRLSEMIENARKGAKR
jgi:BlaI family transcriptional regulator, penicillinase repressor